MLYYALPSALALTVLERNSIRIDEDIQSVPTHFLAGRKGAGAGLASTDMSSSVSENSRTTLEMCIRTINRREQADIPARDIFVFFILLFNVFLIFIIADNEPNQNRCVN